MEGIEDFFKGVLKVLIAVVLIALLTTSITLYEENKELKKGINDCQIELRVLKQMRGN